MARLSAQEVRRADELAHDVSVWGERPDPVAELLPARLADLLDAEQACVYGFSRQSDGLTLEFLRARDYPSERLAADMDAVVRTSPGGWGPFDPLRVPAAARDRPVLLTRAEVERTKIRSPAFRVMLERHPAFDDREQLRVLACDGPVLVAWAGAFRRKFGWREAALLRRATPAIVRRLRMERQLGATAVALAAVDALLENVAGAAFVVDGRGRPVHANSAGQALLARAGSSCRAELAGAARREPAGRFRSVGLSARGAPGQRLVLERAPRPDAAGRAARLAARLGLTARQREVLTLLALGTANKTIAAELGIAEGTVELHVTALLARAGCGSRAHLVARLWTEG